MEFSNHTAQNTQSASASNNCGRCKPDGCYKLNVFDWLSNVELPDNQKPFDCIEIRFKNGRKAFYKNINNLSLVAGEIVAVEASPGHDIGIVSLTGELVRLQMKWKKVSPEADDLKKIYRKASRNDIKKWEEAQKMETSTMIKAREIADELNLKMKISDVEYQGDKTKAVFYFTANERVDFRELIKAFVKEFKIKVEMRQLGMRQEASKLGGIGDCGKELCCSKWLTDFKPVSTSSARHQQLSLNPQKLAGQCGKLKCCLNYELDAYLDAIEAFPDTRVILKTEKGTAQLQKIDVFKKLMWFTYEDNPGTFYALPVNRVWEIKQMNDDNKKPADLSQQRSDDIITEKEKVVGFKSGKNRKESRKYGKKKPGKRNKG